MKCKNLHSIGHLKYLGGLFNTETNCDQESLAPIEISRTAVTSKRPFNATDL